jgi:hypothetical protein
VPRLVVGTDPPGGLTCRRVERCSIGSPDAGRVRTGRCCRIWDLADGTLLYGVSAQDGAVKALALLDLLAG